jgi:predicted peptidase
VYKRFILSCWIAVAAIAATGPAHAADVADLIDFSLRDAKHMVVLPGRLYVPPEAKSDSHATRPLILFLHGSGEGGTDNLAPINGNVDNLLAEAKRRGAFLYAPQAPGEDWNSAKLTSHVMAMIARAVALQNVDPHRLYLTGLSSGGAGVWNMLSRYPRRFAAAVPISGDTPACDFMARNLVNTSLCIFQARDDDVVPVAEGRKVVNSILTAAKEPFPAYPAANAKAGLLVSNPSLDSHRRFQDVAHQQREATDFFLAGTQLDLLYNELATGGHGIWPAVYNTPAVYDWLFAHALAAPDQLANAKAPTGALKCCGQVRFRLWRRGCETPVR